MGLGVGMNLSFPRFSSVQNDYSITSYSPRVGTDVGLERITGSEKLFDFRIVTRFQMHRYLQSLHWFAQEDLDFPAYFLEVNSKLNSFGISIGTGVRILNNENIKIKVVASPFLQGGRFTSQIDLYTYGSNKELIGPYSQGGEKRGEWYWGGNLGVEILLNLSERGNLVFQNLYGYGETVGLITSGNEQIYLHTPLITSGLAVSYRYLIGSRD